MLKPLRTCRLVAAMGWAAALSASAQVAPLPSEFSDPLGRPTAHGVRFTPGMARALGRSVAKDVLARRYELQEDRIDEASEAIARRLMQAAHSSEEQAQALCEFCLTQGLEFQADYREGKEMHGMPRLFGQEFAEQMMPLLPAVRDVIKNVGQDIRPMLAVKQQLKLGADLMTLHTGLDAFEKNMERWSRGEVDPFGNPFQDEEKKITLDEQGQSKEVKEAGKQAENSLNAVAEITGWEQYVKQAKAFYRFDDAQGATADSILRETTQRAGILAQDETYRQRVYRNRLWFYMKRQLPMGWNSPLAYFVERDYETLTRPIEALGQGLKRRIDEIPTESQRRHADERMMTALAEHGFESQDH